METETGGFERGKEGAKVRHVQDVVGSYHLAVRIIALTEVSNLSQSALCRFASEGEVGAVEAAEGTVRPFTPPAAARGLKRQNRPDQPGDHVLLELRKVIAKVRVGQVVQRAGERRLAHRGTTGTPAAEGNIGKAAQVLAAPQTPHQLRQHPIGFARADDIDEREQAVQSFAHLLFAAWPAEEDRLFRVARFEAARQRKRCGSLAARASEPDDVVGMPVDALHALDEKGRDVRAHLERSARHRLQIDLRQRPILAQLGLGNGSNDLLKMTTHFRTLAKEVGRKEPITQQHKSCLHFPVGGKGIYPCHDILPRPAYAFREGQVEIEDITGEPGTIEAGLQQADPKGRIMQTIKRHVHQQDSFHGDASLPRPGLPA